MRMTVRFFDHKGWPRMAVDPPVREAGDGLRIQNWANDRYKDFRAFCDEHKALTEAAMSGRRGSEYGTKFGDVWRKVLERWST